MKRNVLSAVVCWALLGMAAEAHHAIATVYDDSQQATVEGVVTEFEFINPHPLVVMDVQADGGKVQQWRLEMDTHRELAEIGFTRETLKPGDRVVVKGSRARKQAQSLYIRRLDRPSDGFSYEQVGNSPRIRTPARPPSTGQLR